MLALAPVSGSPKSTPGSVEFTVTTKTSGEKYAPRHVIAVWVTDSKGNFVRTLELRAREYVRHLRIWRKGSQGNTVDAITGASLRAHQSHKLVWDCKNAKGELVPDGEYRIHVEFTEKNGQGPVIPANHIRFTKGPKAVSLTPADLPQFVDMKLSYTPATSTEQKETQP
jgi:hypothetical protein